MSSFCVLAQVHVFPESEGLENVNRDELSTYNNNYNEYIISNEQLSDYNFNKNSENGMIEKTEHNFKDFCLGEDHSVISHSDIKYLIEDKAETLKIKEKILNSCYPVAEEEFKRYMGHLEEFLKRFKERPGHMLHVLHSMASWRENLEPDVEEIATQLEQFQILEDNFNAVAKGSVVMLKQLEKYKNICKINCEEIDIDPRFGHEIINDQSKVLKATGMYCIRLKDLNDYINKKLNEAETQYNKGLDHPLKNRDILYEQNISELKSNLKEAAVKEFGMTMYDILSLHDDYHHFKTYLEHVNISSEIYNIMEDTAEISFKRIGLKRDLEKYRQYCMECGNHRVKRNVFEEEEELPVISIEKNKDWENKTGFSVDAAVDELIQAKINEIKESINSNLTNMFAGLDDKLNDPNVIDHYISGLQPIQEVIENEIKTEQEALHRLRSRMPEASIDKILVLSKEVKQMVQNLESAKQFIDRFVQ